MYKNYNISTYMIEIWGNIDIFLIIDEKELMILQANKPASCDINYLVKIITLKPI